MDIPTYNSLMNPLLEALHQLGGSGTIDEINEKTIENLELPDEITDIPHGYNSGRNKGGVQVYLDYNASKMFYYFSYTIIG